MAEANRFLEELFWPAHNARFARPAADTWARPSWLLPARSRTSSAPRRTASSRATTVRYKNRTLQIPADRHRHHYVKAQVRVRISRRPPGRLPRTQVSGALPRRRRNHRRRQAPGRVTRFDATEPGPARQSSRPDHLSTAQPPQQKRSIHLVHKAVNSVSYRHAPKAHGNAGPRRGGVTSQAADTGDPISRQAPTPIGIADRGTATSRSQRRSRIPEVGD